MFPTAESNHHLPDEAGVERSFYDEKRCKITPIVSGHMERSRNTPYGTISVTIHFQYVFCLMTPFKDVLYILTFILASASMTSISLIQIVYENRDNKSCV